MLEPAQMVVADAVMVMVGVTLVLTDMVMLLLVTVLVEIQSALLVNTQVTMSPLFRAVVTKLALLVPTSTPFIFHWKTGAVPPLVTVAVNVPVVPEHMVVELAAMEIVGVTAGVMVMVIGLLVAVAGAAQVALLVSIQVTISPLFKVLVVKVELLVPASIPFIFH